MKNITQHTNIETDGNEVNSLAPVNPSFLEPTNTMHSLFGETSLMTVSINEPESDKRESTVPCSRTTVPKSISQASLSDKVTPLLMSLGLIKGITPTSIRKRLGQRTLDFAFSKPDGDVVDEQKEGF